MATVSCGHKVIDIQGVLSYFSKHQVAGGFCENYPEEECHPAGYGRALLVVGMKRVSLVVRSYHCIGGA